MRRFLCERLANMDPTLPDPNSVSDPTEALATAEVNLAARVRSQHNPRKKFEVAQWVFQFGCRSAERKVKVERRPRATGVIVGVGLVEKKIGRKFFLGPKTAVKRKQGR